MSRESVQTTEELRPISLSKSRIPDAIGQSQWHPGVLLKLAFGAALPGLDDGEYNGRIFFDQ
jgi:hypothetical protein